MNKSDKFHGAEFEINAQAISDDELDAVAGGTGGDQIYCIECHRYFKYEDNYIFHLEYCKEQYRTLDYES